MALRKSSAGARPAAPAPPGAAAPAAPKSRARWIVRLAVALAVGAAVWGAWTAFRPQPLRDAREALDRRDYPAATEILTKYLSGHRDDPEALLLLARAARHDADYVKAAAHLRDYAAKHPQGAAYGFESDLLEAYTGSTAHADKLFAAYSGKPDDPDAPWAMEAYLEGTLRARVSYAGAKFDPDRDDPAVVAKLHTAAEIWLAHRPGRADQAQGLMWQGRIYGYAHELDKSLARYREALALDPEHFEARYHLAIALVQIDPDECLKHFDVLLKQKPGNRFLRFLAATTRRRFGRFDEARPVLDAMLKTDPNDIAALVELAQVDLDEGKHAAAEPLLQRALQIGPNVPEANLAMSRCQQLAGHPAEAERYRKRYEETQAARDQPRVPAPVPKQ